MKTWSVETLSLAAAAIVLLLAGGTAVHAVSQVRQVAIELLVMIGALAAVATMVLLRIRSVTMARNGAFARLRHTQRRFRRLVETAHEGICVLDLQQACVFVNPRLQQMFGCPASAMLGRSMVGFLGENPVELWSEVTGGADEHAGRTHDLCYRRVDGSLGWAIVSGRAMMDDDGNASGTLLMLTDITERKNANMELASIQSGLEARVHARTAEVLRTNAQLRAEIAARERAETALKQSFLQLRQLTAHLETIKEDERKRIALDIHDDLGQNLMALRIDAEMLRARAGERHPLLERRASSVIDTIDASIRAARAIMNDLHPSTLELGLAAAVEWLVTQFEHRSGIATSLSVTGDADALPDNRRTAVIFRIIQESLVNILRHADATHVEVTLKIAPGALSIMIVDDGIGMHPDDAGKAAAFGLRSIKERVDVFGGELLIQSRRGIGTTLSIRIPLETPADALSDSK